MFGLFKKKALPRIVANLNARIQPFQRGEFEDRIEEKFRKDNFSAEIVGGGTLQESNGEIIECDIEFELQKLDEKSVLELISAIEDVFAPKGSALFLPREIKIEFGKLEGLAIYAKSLATLEECDFEFPMHHLENACNELLQGIGKSYNNWHGSEEMAIYFYGDSFKEMRSRIEPFISSHPDCKISRLVQIA